MSTGPVKSPKRWLVCKHIYLDPKKIGFVPMFRQKPKNKIKLLYSLRTEIFDISDNNV